MRAMRALFVPDAAWTKAKPHGSPPLLLLLPAHSALARRSDERL